MFKQKGSNFQSRPPLSYFTENTVAVVVKSTTKKHVTDTYGVNEELKANPVS